MSSPDSLRAPLLWLLLPFTVGLACADRHPPTDTEMKAIALGAVACALVAALAHARRTRSAPAIFGSALLLCGAALGYLWLPLRSPPAGGWNLPPREVNVVLRVDQVYAPLPQRRTFSGIGTVVDAAGPAATLRGQRVYFAAIRRISRTPELGGHYHFRGVVGNLPPPAGDGRGFERYLASLGVRVQLMRGHLQDEVRPPSAFRRFCVRAQKHLEGLLAHGLDGHPQLVSLYQAMLLGEKAVISQEQQTAFVRSGVFHVFTISGLHVGAIAGALLAALVLLRVPRRPGAIIALVILWLYVQITGGNTPAERAFIMIAFGISSRVFQLPGNLLAALAAAALTTLLLEPRQLFSTGFQMSYSVVGALVLMGVPLKTRWQDGWRPWRSLPEADWSHAHRWAHAAGRSLLGAAAITWAAILASTPSSIGNFGVFSPGALLGNLIVVPLAGAVIGAGFLALLCGLVGLTPLTVLFNHAAALVIFWMDWIVRHGVELPGMYFHAQFEHAWMTPAALVVLIGLMLLGASRRWRAPWGFWLPFAALTLMMILGVKFG